jgi:hypothetical protein
VLYAVSLAAGVLTDDAAEVQWETLFVRAIDDLDPAHIELLDLFPKTANQLGLGSGAAEFDAPVNSLNSEQLDIVAGHLPNRASLLAVLERHGLIIGYTATGGMAFSIGAAQLSFAITDFGSEVHERLAAVGRYLSDVGG